VEVGLIPDFSDPIATRGWQFAVAVAADRKRQPASA
jgi:hypothetical protein